MRYKTELEIQTICHLKKKQSWFTIGKEIIILVLIPMEPIHSEI